MPLALKAAPELAASYDGFIWYPNTLSFGHTTVTGLPALAGGYDYSPEALDARAGEPLVDKINEALRLMPALAGGAGLRVTVTDPTMANMQLVPDLSIYHAMPNVSAYNLDGRKDTQYQAAFPPKEERFVDSFDFDILFRYGLFRIALPALRYGIHYKGTWWRDGATNAYGRALTEFATLYYLSDFCYADEGADTFALCMNETTHEPGAYTAALRPQQGVIRYSDAERALFGTDDNCAYMYTFIAALTAAARWLEWLKAQGLYDNTRIIIVSDHGAAFADAPGFVDAAGGAGSDMAAYNPLLMVKERGARGPLASSSSLMTNADTPRLALRDLAAPLLNPYTGAPLSDAPASERLPLTVSAGISFQPRLHGPNQYHLKARRSLHAPDVFSASAWGNWEPPNLGVRTQDSEFKSQVPNTEAAP
jgi:hypothetical protein